MVPPVHRSVGRHAVLAASCCLLLTVPLWSSVAHAQKSSVTAPDGGSIERDAARSTTVTGGAAVAGEEPGTTGQLPVRATASVPVAVSSEATAPPERGRLLTMLYASFATLQVADLHSTFLALDRGAREANPVMAPFAEHRPLLVGLKLGAAAGSIYMTERLRRHSRVAAILTMVAIDSAYLTLVAHNYRVAGRLDRAP